MSLKTLKAIAAISGQVGSVLSILVPIVVLPRARRSPVAFVFFWWLALAGATNIIAKAAAILFQNNHPVYLGYRLISVLLLSRIAYLSLDGARSKKVVVYATMVFLVIWVGVIASGAESPLKPSLFTSPAERVATLLTGVFMIGAAIRETEVPPMGQAATWLGIGLVLAGGTGAAVFPIIAETMVRAPEYATLVKPFSAVFSHVALIIWCITYWKRGIVWTR